MKVRTVPVEAGDVLLVPGDLHFDQHDQVAIDVMLATARAAGVNGVCLIGDTFESAGISRHPGMRRAKRFRNGAGTIKAEGAAAGPTLRAMRALVSENRRGPGGLHVLTGNHDHWWAGVQDDYPGLMDTPWFELYGDVFDGWHVHEEYVALKYGQLLVCHGHRLRGSLSKHPAAAVLANYPGQNTLFGHSHRIDESTTPTFKYGTSVAHGAWTIGHMKDRDVEIKDSHLGQYAERHQQGFAVIHFFDRGGDVGFEVTKVRIHRDDADRPLAVWKGEVIR